MLATVWAECFLLMYIYRELLARYIDRPPTHVSSSNYILFSPPSVFCLLAFLLLFWLGSATGHRPHTPILPLFSISPNNAIVSFHYAATCSAVVQGIRSLDGHRASPLVLNSLHFFSEGEVNAYHFPEEAEK